ncbi:MAG: type II toxin-antitoxin system HicB family antitoxin [Chloroflexi bacterium]|nr:type II toxin-antitoxin system HicB family antitoxin [Chloroflexota bacterium]
MEDKVRQVTSKQLTRRRKTREFTVVIERDEDGWYVGTVPELRACYTQARSLDELAKRMKEVIALCLDRPRTFAFAKR